MSGLGEAQQTMTLHDYLGVVRRRVWTILAAVVLVVLAAIALSLHEKAVYQAKATLLLGCPASSSQTSSPAQTSGCAQVDVPTLQSLALSKALLENTIRKSGVSGHTSQQLLQDSSVSQPPTNAAVLTFTVNDRDPRDAVVLARTYAEQFSAFQEALNQQAYETAYHRLVKRISELSRKSGPLYSRLLGQAETIKTQEALQTSKDYLISASSTGVKVSPKPVRNAVLGLVLGIILGLALAFLREALDTRVRSADEIGHRLPGIPLLGRVPAPPKRLAESGRLAMLVEPHSPHSEPFRMLRTNLDLILLDRDVHTIMITSAV